MKPGGGSERRAGRQGAMDGVLTYILQDTAHIALVIYDKVRQTT